jgi:hypothetical protein
MSENSEAAAMVRLTIGSDESVDAAEIEELTQRLRRELLELDVESVERPRSQDVPAGAKAIDFAQLGELVVTLGKTAPAFAGLAGVLHQWLRSPGRTLHLEMGGDVLDLSSASAEQQQAALEVWLTRQRYSSSEG